MQHRCTHYVHQQLHISFHTPDLSSPSIICDASSGQEHLWMPCFCQPGGTIDDIHHGLKSGALPVVDHHAGPRLIPTMICQLSVQIVHMLTGQPACAPESVCPQFMKWCDLSDLTHSLAPVLESAILIPAQAARRQQLHKRSIGSHW